jgi:uncharacterized membrane protein YeiB
MTAIAPLNGRQFWQPTAEAERCTALDAIRGLALLGVSS